MRARGLGSAPRTPLSPETPGRSGTWKARAAGFPRPWRGVWGPGRWLRRGMAGRRTSSGHRELGDRLPGSLLRSIAGQSNLTPHPKRVQMRHRAGAAAGPLRRCSAARDAAQPSASGSVSTKAAPEAPARPLTRHPQADQPPLTSQSGRKRRQSLALSSPVRRGRLRRCGVPWLTPARQPGR